ncbi:peptidase G2 autoproteolytic cleavage domain-containing protein [Bacillus pumilus]|uniref:peptidase G2 autoproteolytic cleavage domain-containing protein n=1 Tax=Bacillus pumilus TaxID=1408 RepID=UPI002FDF87F0
MAFENELIPVNTLGVQDEETGKWIPVDAVALRSHTDRLTIDEIKDKFIETYNEILKVDKSLAEKIMLVDKSTKDEINGMKNTIGNIDDFHATGTNLVEKVINSLIERRVNVKDFGAKGDGVTNDQAAFELALSSSYSEIFVPEGTYLVMGLSIPSYTRLIGVGKSSIIKLHKSADPKKDVIVTKPGAEYVQIENLTADWNRSKTNNTIGSGANATCISIKNAKFVWIRNVYAENAGLHGFDVTSPSYNKSTDNQTVYQTGGSSYVWIDNCVASNFGDDGFTTHFSEYIFITNCYSFDGNGSAHPSKASNTNGFEVDDGSKNVWIGNCHSRKNARGFEVKAHASAPAAQNVNLSDCTSLNDIRSFDFRHIGHHLSTDPLSTTARNINVVNCFAIKPIYSTMYEGLSPKALVVSAFVNVNISNFHAIGDPSYDYKKTPAIAFQYKSRNINVSNITVKDFRTSDADIYIYGGAQKTDYINISNVSIFESAPIGIKVGSGVTNVNISNGSLIGRNAAGSIGIYCYNNQANINSVNVEKYSTPSEMAGNKYTFIPNNFKNGTRIATTSGYAKTKTSFIAASTGGAQVTAEAAAVIATTGGAKARGMRNAVIASSGGSNTSTEGSRSLVVASNNSSIVGAGSSRVVIGSNGVANKKDYTTTWGYGTSTTPLSSNIKLEIHSKSGDVTSAGQVKGGSTFSDYAEYFESADGKSIPSGYFVTLENEKIKKANLGDQVLGVISETAGIVLGESTFNWQGRYVKNEFGGLIYEDVDVTFINQEGIEVTETRRVPKENPYFNPEEEYVARSERPEWNVVGMFGQVHVRIDETVQAGDKIVPKAGKGTKSTSNQGFHVMKVTTPFSKERGFGVAVCLITPQY